MILPTNFANDIQGRDTGLVPFVLIGDITSSDLSGDNIANIDDLIAISTNTLELANFRPILLNIPSIKESIDIEKRNYRISNVSIQLSNYEYNGVRFSELVSDSSLINTECRIFWRSPASGGMQIQDLGSSYNPNSAFQVYYGVIRRYEHDDDKVKLTVEDRSQSKLHKDLPIANLGTGDEVLDKYKNKPIPMVYGHVDRSPCVIKSNNLVMDSKAILGLNTVSTNSIFTDDNEYPIYISLNEAYASVPSQIEEIIEDSTFVDEVGDLYIIEPQWFEVDDGENNKVKLNTSKLFGLNGLQVRSYYPPIKTRLIDYEDHNPEADYINYIEEHNEAVLYDNNLDTLITISDLNSLFSGTGSLPSVLQHFELLISTSPPYDVESRAIAKVALNNYRLPIAGGQYVVEAGGESSVDIDGNNNIVDYTNLFTIDDDNGADIYFRGRVQAGAFTPKIVFHRIDTPIAASWFSGISTYGVGFISNIAGVLASNPIAILDAKLKEIFITSIADIKNPLSKIFYANVNGRAMNGILSPTAPEVINDIMENELGQTAGTTQTEYSDWKYAFTVDKKINSKKLLEGIASASPFIPRFNNMGEFKFDVISKYYEQPQIDDSRRIKKDEVISFSYSRTKIEDVKTKVKFKYNWDYGRKEYMDSVNNEAGYTVNEILPPNNTYEYDYYGLVDDADSTLIIDDDRGKYIRDHTTAKEFAKWMLALNCNAHLKIKVRLPLNYLDIEVGSLISFDGVMGNANPYNIDYGVEASFYKEGDNPEVDLPYMGHRVNGQQAFPLFLCTATKKSISYVDIEVYQLHNLTESDIRSNDVLGVTDPNAWNYNEEATIDNGTGRFGTDFIVPSASGGCPIKYHPTGDLAGDPNVLDASQNFPVEPLDAYGELIILDNDGNIANDPTNGVFVIDNLSEAYRGSPAYDWWVANNGEIDPVIYFTLVCIWTDFIKHRIMEFTSYYLNVTQDPVFVWNTIEESFMIEHLNSWADQEWVAAQNWQPWTVSNESTIILTEEWWNMMDPTVPDDEIDLWKFLFKFNNFPMPTFAGNVTAKFEMESLIMQDYEGYNDIYGLFDGGTIPEAFGHPVGNTSLITQEHDFNIENNTTLEIKVPARMFSPTEWVGESWPPQWMQDYINAGNPFWEMELNWSLTIISNESPDTPEFFMQGKVRVRYEPW